MPKDVERSQIHLPPRREATEEPEQRFALRRARPRRRRIGLFVSLSLVTLATIVVLTGLLMHFGSSGPLSPGVQATTPVAPQALLSNRPIARLR